MKRGADGTIQFEGAADLPLVAQSFGTTAHVRTGAWRSAEPYYEDLRPPCAGACLAGGDVVRWMLLAAEERFVEALDVLRQANPFPAICGRVCPHPCERDCSRGRFGGAVRIRAIERFLGDYAVLQGHRAKVVGSRRGRVAVVGSGPAGLSCAYFLARQGYRVRVFEAEPAVGGLLRWGIPPFRLPRAVLDAELRFLSGLPIEFMTGRRLGRDLAWDEVRAHDAVFLAMGRARGRPAGIEGAEGHGMVEGLDFLRRFHAGEPVERFRKALVVGGGNTAMDCARVARRLGAKVLVAYRRTREEMPALPEEVVQAEEEEVKIEFQVVPVGIRRTKKRLAVRFVRTRQGEPDASGRRAPVPIPGSEFEAPCDQVLWAIGEGFDSAGLPDELRAAGGVKVDGSFATAAPGVFAGGDGSSANPGTVAAAIAQGRHAAAAIDRALAGATEILVDLPAARGVGALPLAPDRIRPAYVPPSARSEARLRDAAWRTGTFLEVEPGPSYAEVLHEAQRCLACGTCVECDNCLVFCPDLAIRRRPEGGYEIDLAYCKGCGICVAECPRGAIQMRSLVDA